MSLAIDKEDAIEATEAPTAGAQLSQCRRFRYRLWRVWDGALPSVLFIMLNPSIADECDDDPTIRRCIGFAKAWGFGGIEFDGERYVG